ncbi:hypothetical protein [Persephonella sp.]|uniref:hypothetical protein n=1 Tax=Persephonella sp. TaxID=2060922 RepID=UPI0025D82742|nr:hypothetical protein [Persephonella sp.]
MKYKVSKEELDALFREVYSTPEKREIDYTTQTLKIKEEYSFLAYKYKNILKGFLISNLPVKVQLKSFKAYEGSDVDNKNFFVSGYDVEKKYRVYLTVSENIEDVIKKAEGDLYRLFDEKFNVQNFIENLSESFISELKKDLPFSYKKINSSSLQFYEDKFVKLEYIFSLEESRTEFSIWLEKELLENGEISPFIFSPPTSLGKKKLKRLKDLLKIRIEIESEPVVIDSKDLKVGNEIDLKIKIKDIML